MRPRATARQLGYLRHLLDVRPTHPLHDEDDLEDYLLGLSIREASGLIEELLGRTAPPSTSECASSPSAATSIDVPGTNDAVSTPKPAFAPSPYQAAIFNAIEHEEGNLFVEAVAGSGKTTTIVEALKLVKGTALFCAFNKAIADELRGRVPEAVEVKTLHSLGFQALRAANNQVKLDEHVVKDVLEECLPSSMWGEERSRAVSFGERMVGLLKNCLVDPGDTAGIGTILDHYAIEDNGVGAIVLPLLPRVFDLLDKDNRITFDDMIYRPVKMGLPLPQYDVVLVDEAQDLNPAQIALVLRLGARTIAVGDRYQSIYGFRGADINAIPTLIERLDMRVLPLSITYRCPQSHVRMAQAFVPAITAREGAPEGTVEHKTLDELVDTVAASGVLMICRTNAPTVSTAFRLIRAGIPAQVRGRDIGQGLISLIKKVGRAGDDLQRLLERANDHFRSERAKLVARRASDTRLQALDDRADTLFALCEGVESVSEALRRAETLFSDTDGKGMVVLSSVHRAKGLEAETVVILQPWLLPLRVKQSWEHQQEANIMYVAYTRSKERLVLEKKGG